MGHGIYFTPVVPNSNARPGNPLLVWDMKFTVVPNSNERPGKPSFLVWSMEFTLLQ